MKHRVMHMFYLIVCMSIFLLTITGQAKASKVTLSLYDQGFNINEFYDNGEFSVENGIKDGNPEWLLVVIGDPANVEDVFETATIPNPFDLEIEGVDFHFEVFQPFRFPDRFDGLFSKTVDDPVLFVFDSLTVADVQFYDDGILADDRIDLSPFAEELPEFFFEVDAGDRLYVTMLDGTTLRISNIVRTDDFSVGFDVEPVPEPGTFLMLGLGVIGIIGLVRKKRNMRLLKKTGLLLICIIISFSVSSYAYDIGPDFCSSMSHHACPAFQDAYDAHRNVLGEPVSAAAKNAAGEWYQKFEHGTIEYRGYSAYVVYGAIYNKWASLNWGFGDLGGPTSNRKSVKSIKTGVTGDIQNFDHGYIIYYKGRTFEVHGDIATVYAREGGATGWLGFPTSDEYADSNSPGDYRRSDFEGGYITWNGIDQYLAYNWDGVAYQNGKPLHTELIAVKGPCCVNSGRKVSTSDFIPTWSTYAPSDAELISDPSTLYSRASMTETYNALPVIASGYKYGSATCSNSVTAVNSDVAIMVKDVGFNLENLTRVYDKTKGIFEKSGLNNIGLCSLEFGSLDVRPFNYNYSKICCADYGSCIREQKEVSFAFDVNVYKMECDFPLLGVPYAASVNARVKSGFSAGADIYGKTTCEKFNVCGDFHADFMLGGGVSATIGANVGGFDLEVADADLILQVESGVQNKNDFCWKPGQGLDPFSLELHTTVKVVGEVKVFSIFGGKAVDWKLGSFNSEIHL